jgi:hypothetical protein
MTVAGEFSGTSYSIDAYEARSDPELAIQILNCTHLIR